MDKIKPLQTLNTFLSKNSSYILVFVEMLINPYPANVENRVSSQ
jgi:hypothetical protein